MVKQSLVCFLIFIYSYIWYSVIYWSKYLEILYILLNKYSYLIAQLTDCDALATNTAKFLRRTTTWSSDYFVDRWYWCGWVNRGWSGAGCAGGASCSGGASGPFSISLLKKRRAGNRTGFSGRWSCGCAHAKLHRCAICSLGIFKLVLRIAGHHYLLAITKVHWEKMGKKYNLQTYRYKNKNYQLDYE